MGQHATGRAPVSPTKLQLSEAQSVSLPDEIGALLRQAWARDLRLLAALNDQEPTAELLDSLRSSSAEDWFGFKANTDVAAGARGLLDTALDAMPNPIDAATLNDLAVDYAAIYLLHTYRAPPTESPWLDKDQLERQEPMFEAAAWYRRFGLAAQDRQRRSDDHFVLQLQFLAHLLSTPELDAATSALEASRFMDQHLLLWISDFATRVASRCATPYYCGVVTLTDGYLNAFRDALAEHYALPRPIKCEAVITDSNDFLDGEIDEVAPRYIPGISPSW